ncbi:MAG: hypothetical protein ACREOI_20010 [bacterium]
MFASRRKIVGNRAGLIFGMLCLASLLSSGAVTVAQAQTACESELAEAKQKYEAALFDQAIDLIDRCLNKSGLSEADQLRAYRLKALTYQAKDYISQAKDAIRKLLQQVPNYKPDPAQDPPPYIELVDQVRQELPPPTEPVTTVPPKKKSRKKWLWIGSGAVVLGAGAALALSGGGGGGTPPPSSPQLPMPPSLP